MKYALILKAASILIAATAFAPGCLAQTQLAGDWQGTLNAGGTSVRLVLHIAEGNGGNLTATLDSPDQGASGIPVSSISLQGSTLKLAVETIHGSYEGQVNQDAGRINGTWSQGSPFTLNFTRLTAQSAARAVQPAKFDGTWSGPLNAGAIQLRIVFKITTTEAGPTVMMQSPDQNPSWIPATSASCDGSSLHIEIKSIAAIFDGRIATNHDSIDGTFTQGGNSMPLALKRVNDESSLARRRPQNPVKPYPYREEEVTFAGGAAGVTLAGTLTIPQGKGPFPAVLLIAGSGPNDRDESLMGHKPFLVLSDYLTRHGIATLRADKRGIGKSTGNYAAATTADFANDAQAGVNFLKARPEADPRRIGLIGHSEGGIIAPIVAARDSDVAFVGMMAGSGVPGDQIIVAQALLIAEASGISEKTAEQSAEQERKLLKLIETEPDGAALDRQLRAMLAADHSGAGLDAQIAAVESPWFRYFLTFDPAEALRKIHCPVLVLNGEKDLQVPSALNLPAIRRALDEANNKRYEIDGLPGLNHLFQTAKTGLPAEYATIEETIAPAVLDRITGWILRR